jgi:glucarate dehydratase
MKIEGLKATVVAVPIRRASTSTWYGADRRVAVLVEVFTDQGIVGLGEMMTPLGAEPSRAIIESAEPLLVGEDPTNVEPLKKKLYAAFNLTHLHIHAGCWALNGIDMALWDILGKACGQPLYRVWGGAFRKHIDFYGPIDAASPEEVAEQARRLVKEGFRTLYTKVGFSDEEDEARVRAMREAAGQGIKIRLDANQSWSSGEAVKSIQRLSRYDLEFVDQPVLMYNIDDLARVRAAVDVPIASHESSWTMYDALNVIKKGAADIIHVDPRLDAGLGGGRITAGMAEAAGIPVVMHSYHDMGISQCAKMHLIASSPNFTLANQGGGYYPLADDIIEGGPMKFKDGCLEVPEKPGIGVALDKAKVAEFSRYYEENLKDKGVAESAAAKYGAMQYRRFFGR